MNKLTTKSHIKDQNSMRASTQISTYISLRNSVMKLILGTTLSLGFMSIPVQVLAHEGHDNAPGALKANHGGVVKAGKEINLEYLVSGNEVKLYPVSHEGKDLLPNDVKLSGTTQLPKGKVESAKIEIKDNVYYTTIDFKGAYRSELKIKADHAGKVSEFKIQIEK